ncbi:MAG: cupin domain-containing protein [Gammaproteobacteria bacterium]|nr:cupin domain-containing protein [Gammaproteobacteria bacterium]
MREDLLRRQTAPFRWDRVSVLEYKQDGSAPFLNVTRQVLFDEAGLGCQLRYFEVAPGGHTTLERHEHVHAVVVVRGAGRCLLGTTVREVGPQDLVTVPARTWHQFRAGGPEPLGFLCMVNRERDRPELPGAEDLCALTTVPAVAAFLDAAED